MIYIAKDNKSLYLSHHGILGQKWGKKQGPPYPLSAGDHSKAEKKAGYKKSIGGETNPEMYGREAKKAAKKAEKLKKKEEKRQFNKNLKEVNKEVNTKGSDLNKEYMEYIKQNTNVFSSSVDVAAKTGIFIREKALERMKNQKVEDIDNNIKKTGEDLIKDVIKSEDDFDYKKEFDKIVSTAKTDEEKDIRLRELDERNNSYKDFKLKDKPGEYSEENIKRQKDILNRSDKDKKTSISLKNTNIITENDALKNERRTNSAADLGIKALKKIGWNSYDGNKITDNDREWFIYEDQTIGLFTVADLVRQGKSKSQIKSLIQEAVDSSYKDYHTNGVFQLSAGDISDDYIDACIEIAKKDMKK